MPRESRDFETFWHRAGVRVGVLYLVLIATSVVAEIYMSWTAATALGWILATGSYLTWIGLTVLRLGPADTALHATRQDPTQAASQTLLTLATLSSFGSIVLLLVESGALQGQSRFVLAAAALVTVASSWALVHVLFTLRYADLYYRDGATGVDFNQERPPQYSDFSYLAFTIGMTYQVSDTNLTSTPMRREALRHALLSFVLGVVVLAATINLIVSLAR